MQDDERILLVDDKTNIRDLVSRRLERKDYRVDTVENGREALETLDETDPDLVLLDVMMPGMDGFETLEEIREDVPADELPVLMLTAKEGTEGVLEALEKGANDYLKKPVNFPVALARIKSHLKLKRAHDRLQKIANHDQLTGLYNRRYWFSTFEDEFERSRRYGNPLSVMILDLDHFKEINDTYGHPAGDTVLEAFATILNDTLRESDVCARYGGEEFAVLLPETNVSSARDTAERIRTYVEEKDFETDAGTISVTVSIGLTEFSDNVPNLDDLLKQADKALYEAKDRGRNRVETR